MKKLFSLPTLYVLLWALYYTQGTFIPQGSIISRLVLVLFLTISFFYLFVANVKYKRNSYLKALNVLLLMFTVYGVIAMVNGQGFDYLKMIYLSLLPTYPFYVLRMREKIDTKWIVFAFVVMVLVVAVQYASFLLFIEETYKETENTTVNLGYEILALLPLVYFLKRKPIFQYVVLAAVLVAVLSTVKRGAIIVGALCTVYFIYNSLKNSAKKTKWYVWMLALAFVIIGTRYVGDFFANSEYAQMRLAGTLEGDSSGRDTIFTNAWNIFINSNLFGLLFGHGASATIRLMGIFAHNDWLELLVNQGILGAAVYLFYWLAFYKTFRRDRNLETKPVLGTLLIIYFAATLFSMSYNAMTLPANLALGYCLAEQQLVKLDSN